MGNVLLKHLNGVLAYMLFLNQPISVRVFSSITVLIGFGHSVITTGRGVLLITHLKVEIL